MPTVYKDQFLRVDPGNAPPTGTALAVERGEYLDADDNGQIIFDTNDTFNGIAITAVWRNDRLRIELPDESRVIYTGTTFYFASGAPVFTPNDGQVLQDGIYIARSFVTTSTNMPVGTFGPTCFTPDTVIDMQGGRCAVQDIEAGQMVTTLDNGAQPVCAVLRPTVRAYGNFAPIRFEVGSIENKTAFMVSPEYQMLIADWRAQLMTGQDEVLVAAKHLINGCDVGGVVEYVHLLFDKHQIVYGDGCFSESCLLDTALAQHNCAQQAELFGLFPRLAQVENCQTPARRMEAMCLRAA